jgi:hypothetical protein
MYSTIAELRAMLKQLTITIISDALVTSQIENADNEIKVDLSGIINFDLIPTDSTDPTFPAFINLLSKWKTCELSLVYSYSAKREVTTVTDIQYWNKKYEDLIQKIKDGLIPLELSDGTDIAGDSGSTQKFTNPMANTKPYFGTGDYGTYQTEDEKKDDEERG